MIYKVDESISKFALELFYEVEGVCYLEENNEMTRDILQTYLRRKSFTFPKDYTDFSFMCNEVNNTEEHVAPDSIRVDVNMYTHNREYDVVTIMQGAENNIHVNGKLVYNIGNAKR